ncbi:DUF3617 domain-containing protein [Telmatospirillum siberiense]|uniref:DUF3617 domain-containing protein n=1 Tax=Telmatospirillum siberiense TaxID=382514 RepID=A0A2N3PSF0_9PROT|nr:DUF3617 family protein [Telmatospirillum siberiense]PKU23330.1 hypothetical protein CWS72_17000 [Telmatospirillum siberiense]
MRRFSSLLLLLFTAGSALASDIGDLPLKPGLWEVRPLKMIRDGQDVLAQRAAAHAALEKSLQAMPPEKRKRMEELTSGTGRICLSSSDFSAAAKALQPTGCKPTITSKSGNKVSYSWDCTIQGTRSSGKGERVDEGDRVFSHVETQSTDPTGASHGTIHETEMRYVGSDCGSVGGANSAR